MLRYMLGSVKGEKSEKPKGKGKLGNGKGGGEFKVLTFLTFHTSQHVSEHAQ